MGTIKSTRADVEHIRRLALDFDAKLGAYYPRGVPAGGFNNLTWAAEAGDLTADRLLMMHADLTRRVQDYADDHGYSEAEVWSMIYRRNPMPPIHIDIGSHNTSGRGNRAENPAMRKDLATLTASELQRTSYAADRAFSRELHALPREYDHMRVSDMRESGNPAFERYLRAMEWAGEVAAEMRRRREYHGTLRPIKRNPTPRIPRGAAASQPSQLTGEPPSDRLIKRRRKTQRQSLPGIWANPLTRVKVNDPPSRGGFEMDARLLARRKLAKKAPPGFFANPRGALPFRSVEMREREGLEFGLDSVTPVPWTFTTLARATKGAQYSYKLPPEVIASADFQAWARGMGGYLICSLTELRHKIKAFM